VQWTVFAKDLRSTIIRFGLHDRTCFLALRLSPPRPADGALVWRRRRVSVAGERPPRPGQRSAALHTGVGDILKIVRCGAIRIPSGYDGGDFHSVAAIRAGQHETRQMRWGNVRVVHGALPVRLYLVDGADARAPDGRNVFCWEDARSKFGMPTRA
jgi:hypothetical protein